MRSHGALFRSLWYRRRILTSIVPPPIYGPSPAVFCYLLSLFLVALVDACPRTPPQLRPSIRSSPGIFCVRGLVSSDLLRMNVCFLRHMRLALSRHIRRPSLVSFPPLLQYECPFKGTGLSPDVAPPYLKRCQFRFPSLFPQMDRAILPKRI